ncbi:hypothetical protein QJS10_CPB11g00079 [Acorus calamus]|uniref:Late embryogenesis abundant protein n=1 Tax=Acorus calamus TaxID=4465 RepID=A0AAV9DPP5_ACOCL|nr:hypothetical protein QJS10_CPB11g00079 [Acorus calamus]
MAAKSIAGLRNSLANHFQIGRSPHPSLFSPFSTRGTHVSGYEKNVEEQVRPCVVPDDVIRPESDKYWGPHPETGVFGPTTENGGVGFTASTVVSDGGGGASVLDQKAWFRPLEDVDKPQHYNA